MPRGDGRGPAGFGPMTGRGAGYCAGYPVPGYMNPGVGCRRGGRRHMYYATGMPLWARRPYYGAPDVRVDERRELEALRDEARYLREELSRIEAMMEELSEDVDRED